MDIVFQNHTAYELLIIGPPPQFVHKLYILFHNVIQFFTAIIRKIFTLKLYVAAIVAYIVQYSTQLLTQTKHLPQKNQPVRVNNS
jgi:hypothetical protein